MTENVAKLGENRYSASTNPQDDVYLRNGWSGELSLWVTRLLPVARLRAAFRLFLHWFQDQHRETVSRPRLLQQLEIDGVLSTGAQADVEAIWSIGT